MKYAWLLLPSALFALKESPWFGDLAEIVVSPSYGYSYYPSINGAVNPSEYHSHNQEINGYIGTRFLPDWEGGAEANFLSTTHFGWGWESIALGVRYRAYDDIEGDLLSVTPLASIRYLPPRSLRNPSIPYHARVNFELGASIGKEFDRINVWAYRVFLTTIAGQGTHGLPYIRFDAAFEANKAVHHNFGIYTLGYFGFGSTHQVDIDQFHGYGSIHHQSIDLGGFYKYVFSVWGSLRFDIGYRVYAYCFPEKEFAVRVTYLLPFSIF